MSKIILNSLHQDGNIVREGVVKNSVGIEFKPHVEEKILKVRIIYYNNLKDNKHVEHRSVSIWHNVDFEINPNLISSPNFDILVAITQATMGQARVLFVNENLPNIVELPQFVDNKELANILTTLIQTHYN